MKLAELKHKKILIVGAGVEGKATEAFLKHYMPDTDVTITDQKDGSHYLDKQDAYDVVIKSPGIKPEVLKVPYTTATNIFFANVQGITIGITGSKGKTTTSSLVYAILKQAGKNVHLVGNIGNPMLCRGVLQYAPKDIWVCELSSYMTADLHYSPHISVILNLFPEHMDYHGTVPAYYAAKKQIIAYATTSDYFIYNPRFSELTALANETKAQATPFVSPLSFDRSNIPLLGQHNYDNVRAAVTVAKVLNIPDTIIEQAVKSFTPVPHRLENIGTYQGITFYDDAIATIPEATIEAIKALPNIGTLLLGGQNRGYDFTQLATTIISYHIPNLVLFPDSGDEILEAVKRRTKTLPNILQTDSTKEAVAFAYTHTPKGSMCLLSPASPSYSLWENFEERGNEFRKEVIMYDHI